MTDARSTDTRALALVTGASSGIGVAIARYLAADGYNLVLVARREDRLRELANELESRHRIETHVFPADLSRAESGREIAEFIGSQSLDVDLLVNNAGFGLVGRFHEADRERQLDMIRVNVVALTDLTHRVLPGMVTRGRGQILNVASSAAFQPAPIMGVYHATKAFVLFLTEAIAEEIRGTGVTATALCPGPVGQTEFGENIGTDTKVPGLGIVRLDAAKVAKLGVEGAKKGRPIVVPGWWMRLSSWITPRLPRWLVRKITHRIQLSRASSHILPR